MNPEDEKHAQQLIEALKKQNQMMNPTTLPKRAAEPLMNETQALVDAAAVESIKTEPFTPVQGAFSECPQCGMMHPPVKPGTRCPNAKVEIKEAGIKDEDINKFLADLKNIAVSQIQSKGIKDGNKLFKHLTLEITKLLEGYSE